MAVGVGCLVFWALVSPAFGAFWVNYTLQSTNTLTNTFAGADLPAYLTHSWGAASGMTTWTQVFLGNRAATKGTPQSALTAFVPLTITTTTTNIRVRFVSLDVWNLGMSTTRTVLVRSSTVGTSFGTDLIAVVNTANPNNQQWITAYSNTNTILNAMTAASYASSITFRLYWSGSSTFEVGASNFSIVLESQCSAPTPLNGIGTFPAVVTDSGGTTTLTCPNSGNGYTKVGTDPTCTDSMWSALPQCNPATCSAPSATGVVGDTAGGNACDGTQQTGDSCDIKCNTGYSYVSGALTASCNGVSAGTSALSLNLVCQIASCPAIPPVTGGSYSCTDGTNVGSVCTVTCGAGFSGSGSRTCTSGAWSNPAPICYADCTTPTINNGNANCGGATFPHGGTCTPACNNGYRRSGGPIGCNNGAVNGTAVTCAVVSCVLPNGPGYVNGSCSGVNAASGSCNLDCANGYSASADKSLTCQGTAEGVATPMYTLTCTPVACAAYVTNANTTANTCTGSVALGSTCNYACATGFDAVGTLTLTCVGTGPGASGYTTNSYCQARLCSTLYNDAWNGINPNNCQSPKRTGETCTPQCKTGYNPQGTASATCIGQAGNALGIWSTSFSCTPQNCAQPTLSGGTFNCPTWTNNTQCPSTCNAGFTRTGNDPICFASVSILGTVACNPTQCTTPPFALAKDGQSFGTCTFPRTSVTGSCTLGCASGFTFVAGGTQTSVCQPATATPGDPSVVMSNDGSLYTCMPSNCAGVAPPPANGNYNNNPVTNPSACTSPPAANGTVCINNCAMGYNPTGGQTVTCLRGSYVGAPSCTAVNCPALTSWEYVTYTSCGGGPPGFQCNAACKAGFSGGSATLTCTGQTFGTYGIGGATVAYTNHPNCQPSSCSGAITNPSVGTFSGCPAGSFNGTVCTLSCPDGYSTAGSGVAFCFRGNYIAPPLSNVNQLVCQAATCNPPTGLGTGVTAGTCGTATTTATCNTACALGYAQTGGATLTTCTGTGYGTSAWAVTLVCTQTQCPLASLSLTFGQLVNTCTLSNQVAGATCNLACDRGFSASGSSVNTCTAQSGQSNWVNSFQCIPGTCSGYMLGFQQTLNTCPTTLKNGQNCELKCAAGYGHDDNSNTTLYCVADNVGTGVHWYTNLNCVVAPCRIAENVPPMGPNVKSLDCPVSQVITQSCHLGCDDGYNQTKPTKDLGNNAICVSIGDGLVTYNFSVNCTAVKCDLWTIAPGSGQVQNTCPTTFNGRLSTWQSCQLDCDLGYSLSGSKTATCTALSGPAASMQSTIQCTQLTCNAPVPIAAKNQTVGNCVGGTAHYLDTCTMGCLDGFNIPFGQSKTATCLVPVQYTVAFSWNFDCHPSSCTPIPALAGRKPGTCTSLLRTTSPCNLVCDTGYYLRSGTSTAATCLGDTGATTSSFRFNTVCDPYFCTRPTFTAKEGRGSGACNDTSIIGQTCQMKCNDGFFKSGGSYTSTCVSDTPTSVKYTVNFDCTPSKCPAYTLGYLQTIGDCNTPKNTTDTCNLGCVSGYEPSSSTSTLATCTGISGSISAHIVSNLVCVNVNECAVNNGGCSANGQCIDTVGSFSCVCNNGYRGDGFGCGAANVTITARAFPVTVLIPVDLASSIDVDVIVASLPFAFTRTVFWKPGQAVISVDNVHAGAFTVGVSDVTAAAGGSQCAPAGTYKTVAVTMIVEGVTDPDSWFRDQINAYSQAGAGNNCTNAALFAGFARGVYLVPADATFAAVPSGAMALCADGLYAASCPGGGGGSGAAIAAAIVIILLVIIGGGVGYWWWKKRRHNSQLERTLDSVKTSEMTPAHTNDTAPAAAPAKAAPALPSRQGTATGSTAGASAGGAAPLARGASTASATASGSAMAKTSNAASPAAKGSSAQPPKPGAAGAAGGKAKDWSSLALLLADPAGQAAFRAYLQKEMSAENLDFWMAVEEYRKTKQELCKTMSPTEKPLRQAMKPHATKIFTRFLAQTVDSAQVNVPEDVDARTKNRLRQHFDLGQDQEYGDPSKTLFDEAQEVIFKLMDNDSYSRYCKTAEFNRARSATGK